MSAESQSDFAKVSEAAAIVSRWILNGVLVVFYGLGAVFVVFMMCMCTAVPALIVNALMTTAGATDTAALVVSVPVWAGVTFFVARAMWREYR
jgi:hypothetical protein